MAPRIRPPVLGHSLHGEGSERGLVLRQEEHLRRTFGACYDDARFVFITDAGHDPMHETPVYLASLIERVPRVHRDSGRQRSARGAGGVSRLSAWLARVNPVVLREFHRFGDSKADRQGGGDR